VNTTSVCTSFEKNDFACPTKVIVFWKFFSSPQSVYNWQIQHGQSRTVGILISRPLRAIVPACLASALLSLCAYTQLRKTARLLHAPSTAHTVLASLACARCVGKLLCDAAFGSNFGGQLCGTTVGSNFAALQQH
jgi:hypothetical protein